MNPDLLRRYLSYYQDLGFKTLYRADTPQNRAGLSPVDE